MKNSLRGKKINLFLFFTTLCFSAFSQNGNPLQFLSAVSQSSATNPAFQNKTEKLVVGMPFISGITVKWDANFEANNLMTNNFTSDFYNILNESGNAFSVAQVPLIFLSLKKKSSTYSFAITEKVVGSADFDKEILNLLAEGLLPYYGTSKDLGNISLKTQYNREIAFGYATQIAKGFNIGIRPKILFNKLFYDIDDIHFSVETIEELEQLRVTPEGTYSIAGPVRVVVDAEKEMAAIKAKMNPGDYFFRLKNMGAAIDLGLSYNFNKIAEISLSVIDLGFIDIKHEVYTMDFNGSLDYKKSKLYQSSDELAPRYWGPEYALDAFRDSIPYVTSMNEGGKRKLEALPLRLNAMFKYNLPNNFQIGFSNDYSYYNNLSENFFSGFVLTNLGKKFEAVATLNVYKLERIMPGIGGSYTGESVQFYLSSNNFLELVQPSSAKNLNLSFGINFLFSAD